MTLPRPVWAQARDGVHHDECEALAPMIGRPDDLQGVCTC